MIIDDMEGKWKCPICSHNLFFESDVRGVGGFEIFHKCEKCTVIFEDPTKFNVFVIYGDKNSMTEM